MDDPNKELDFQGVFCFLASGQVMLLDTLSRPNGIALSPEEDRLYVAVSDPGHAVLYQYDITEPGRVENKRIFKDLSHLVGQDNQQGLPDGLKINKDGVIFATGPGGLWIFDEEATPLAKIHTGQRTSNCALAYDEKKLFMTADDFVMSVVLK